MRQIMKHFRKVWSTLLGKEKGRMVHVAQDFLGSGTDTWISWHTGRIGGNHLMKRQRSWQIWLTLCQTKRNNTSTTKWAQEPMQTYYSVVLKTLYLLELWTRQRIRIWWTAIQHWHGNDCLTNSLDVITPKRWNWLSNWMSHEWKKCRPWHMDYEFGMSTTKNCRMWKDNRR